MRDFTRKIHSGPENRAFRDRNYLAGTGPVTRFWERKHNVLDGFYRFAIARGYVASTPLPRTFPKPLQPFVPYVYSHEELTRLLSAVVANDSPRSTIDPTTFRLILLTRMVLDFASAKRFA